MDVWEVPQSSCSGLDMGLLMDGGPSKHETMLGQGVLNCVALLELAHLAQQPD